jgi:hypothetical protein
MTYMLDTNACIRYLNGRAPSIRERLESLKPEDVVVCAVVKAELFYGANRSQRLGSTPPYLIFFRSFPRNIVPKFQPGIAHADPPVQQVARGTPRRQSGRGGSGGL